MFAWNRIGFSGFSSLSVACVNLCVWEKEQMMMMIMAKAMMYACLWVHDQMKRLLGNIQIQIIFSHGPSFHSSNILLGCICPFAVIRMQWVQQCGNIVLVTKNRDDMRYTRRRLFFGKHCISLALWYFSLSQFCCCCRCCSFYSRDLLLKLISIPHPFFRHAIFPSIFGWKRKRNERRRTNTHSYCPSVRHWSIFLCVNERNTCVSNRYPIRIIISWSPSSSRWTIMFRNFKSFIVGVRRYGWTDF